MDMGDRKMVNTHTPLYGFTGNEVKVVGTIDLPVLFGTLPYQTWKIVKLHVISASSSYNAILGRTTIAALKAIISISHLKMKFPTEFGVGEVCGDQAIARQCYLSTVIPKKPDQEEQFVNQVIDIDPRDIVNPRDIHSPKDNSCSPDGETIDVEVVVGCLDKITKVGKDLPATIKQEIIDLIREFSDIFAWGPNDMPGIPRL